MPPIKLNADLLNALMDEWFHGFTLLGTIKKEFGAWLCDKFGIEDEALRKCESMHDALPIIYDKYLC